MSRVFVAAAFIATLMISRAAIGAPALRLSIHAENEPARAIVLRISKLFHKNTSVAGDVQGYVTIDLHDVTFEQALEAVVASGNLQVRYEHGIVLVTQTASSAQSNGISGPNVIQLSILRSAQAATIIRELFPGVLVRVDQHANAIIVTASNADLASVRNVIQGLDVSDPNRPVVESISLRKIKAADVQGRLGALFPGAKITAGAKDSLLIRAKPFDMAQIKTVVASLDAAVATPLPAPNNVDAVAVAQRSPADIARALSRQIRSVHAAISGSTIVLTGSPEDVARAKSLVASLDVPPFGAKFNVVYRLQNVDASSVADLLVRSFPNVIVSVDKGLNAISVTANAAEQQRISDAIGRLDGNVSTGGASAGNDSGTADTEIVQLPVIPGQGAGAAATTAQDIANAVTQSLQTHPDLKIVVPNNMQELMVSGSPVSIRKAKELIAKLDVIPQSIVLDTEILELDETGSKNIGLQLSTGATATFTELSPPLNPATGLAGPVLGFQPLSRTPISFQATVNLLLQTGNARVLADPRITTLSGRTASIRAGDTISILTTAGGGSGTVATTQLQSFQTGVQLDITPIVSSDGSITVALHPVVNSLTAFDNGVPQISTRDTQTTVHLQNNQTLVIGGLIEDSIQRTVNKIPLLGDLPLIGGAFRNNQVNRTRNELVIVVTPHIVTSANDNLSPGPPLPVAPKPQALPTLPPGTTLPGVLTQNRPAALVTAPPAAALPTSSPTPSPAPTPSVFASMNIFTFGSPPPNNSSAPGDSPTIFYASYQPTVVHEGTPVAVAVITTTNVQRVAIGPPGFQIDASQVGPGKWTLSYAFSSRGYPGGQTLLSVPIVAFRSDGLSTTVNVPVSIAH